MTIASLIAYFVSAFFTILLLVAVAMVFRPERRGKEIDPLGHMMVIVTCAGLAWGFAYLGGL